MSKLKQHIAYMACFTPFMARRKLARMLDWMNAEVCR